MPIGTLPTEKMENEEEEKCKKDKIASSIVKKSEGQGVDKLRCANGLFL